MWAKRVGWLALIWAASVLALGAVAQLIRLGMGAAGMVPDAAAAETHMTEASEDSQARISDYSRALAFALGRSDSPRERAMSTVASGWDNDFQTTSEQRGRTLRAAAQAVPQDVFVQQIWANADDSESGCSPRSPCPGRRFAWALLEPDNAVAWIPAFDDLGVEPHEARIQDLLETMASASRADDHYVDTLEAWLKAIRSRSVPSGTERSELDEQAIVTYAVEVFPNFGALLKVCKRKDLPGAPAARFELCAQAGRALRDGSQTLLTSVIGATFVRLSGVENDEDKAVLRRLQWLQNRSPIEVVDSDRQFFADLLSTRSELRALQLQMARRGMAAEPPADWVAPRPN